MDIDDDMLDDHLDGAWQRCWNPVQLLPAEPGWTAAFVFWTVANERLSAHSVPVVMWALVEHPEVNRNEVHGLVMVEGELQDVEALGHCVFGGYTPPGEHADTTFIVELGNDLRDAWRERLRKKDQGGAESNG